MPVLSISRSEGFGRPFAKVPQKFIPDPGAGAKVQFGHMPEQGLIGFFFDAKTGAGRVPDHPDHPDRVLMEFFVRIADAADDAVLEIFQPSDVIDERKIPGVVKNPVDRNIPPQSVFRRGPEGVFSLRVGGFLLFLELRLAPESGDLDELSSPEKHMGDAETAADEPRVAEDFLDLMRVGIRGQIEIFRGLFQKKVADTSADQVGNKPVIPEPVKNLQGFRVDILPGERMLRAGDDAGNGRLNHRNGDRREVRVCMF